MPGDSAPFDITVTRTQKSSVYHGVLCIHGFTGTPFEVRYLGERLNERGLWALGPVLPGHGSTPADLARTTWQDWYECVEAALDRLLARCDEVAVVGLSLGGLLALRLAQLRGRDIAAVATLAAPLWLSPLKRMALRVTRPGSLLGRAIPSVPKLAGSDVRDRGMAARNPAYRTMPVSAAHQVVACMDRVRAELAAVTTPILIMHAKRDHTAPYQSSKEIAARVGSAVRIHRALEHSFHLITLDVERDLVATTVGDFFMAHLGAGAPSSPSGRGQLPTKESTQS